MLRYADRFFDRNSRTAHERRYNGRAGRGSCRLVHGAHEHSSTLARLFVALRRSRTTSPIPRPEKKNYYYTSRELDYFRIRLIHRRVLLFIFIFFSPSSVIRLSVFFLHLFFSPDLFPFWRNKKKKKKNFNFPLLEAGGLSSPTRRRRRRADRSPRRRGVRTGWEDRS